MDKKLIVKIFQNKSNNQFSITLPKNKLKILKENNPPKKARINIGDWEW